MTRRTWTTEDGWDVATGYNSMSRKFFIDISRDCPHCDGTGEAPEVGEYPCSWCKSEETEYLFNNLTSSESDGYVDRLGEMTLLQVDQILNKYLTTWPPGLIVSLQFDKADDVRNHEQNYGVIGAVKTAMALNKEV